MSLFNLLIVIKLCPLVSNSVVHAICCRTTRAGTENTTRWLTGMWNMNKIRFFLLICPVGLQCNNCIADGRWRAAVKSMLHSIPSFRLHFVCFQRLHSCVHVSSSLLFFCFRVSSAWSGVEVISIKIDVTSSWQTYCAFVRCWSVIYYCQRWKIPILFLLFVHLYAYPRFWRPLNSFFRPYYATVNATESVENDNYEFPIKKNNELHGVVASIRAHTHTKK